ncbi:hypothetical protein [Clostridium senegalense]|uniref:Uncharacterized protein n=1 Tax=Clostridium senegalense TaxID=1465809 RepID=A0A6M0H536_9CLOT|nr:hypothetical protein [Clostridium senegalense]NEU05729.1 hypothetical protein [Clostridium senegalense]
MNFPTQSPSWNTLRDKIYYTIGKDPYVEVSNLVPLEDGNYTLKIKVYRSINKAKALRAILSKEYKIEDVTVNVIILDSDNNEITVGPLSNYTIYDIASIFCIALHSNRLFNGVIITDGLLLVEQEDMIGQIVVIINKNVVQFYNSNLSDLYGNYTELATKIFEELLIKEYPLNIKVSFSTSDDSCELQNNLYCY